MSAADGTVTYRGRSLEEVLPKIREELGPDAVIERQRTGLVGGVGGFFQREMVEVDARPANPSDPPEAGSLNVLAVDEDEAALRAATAPPPDPDRDEGLQAPAMRRIAEQSTPFADILAGAEQEASEDDDWGGWAEGEEDDTPAPEPEPAAPYTAQAYTPTGRPSLPPPVVGGRGSDREPRFAPTPGTPPEGALFSMPADPAGRPAPPAAASHEEALSERGLSTKLAAAVVGEAVAHAMPFAPARGGLKRQVRATLARRIPVQAGFGGTGRTIALVGTAGSGKTRVAAGLVAAYAAGSNLPAVCLSLRPRDVGAGLAALLEPHQIAVRPVDDGVSARAQIGTRAGSALVVIDTPATSPRDKEGIARLAADLSAAGVTETHVVLSATVAAPVARAALRAYAPLAPAALLITHADETDHLGPLVDLAIGQGMPISFVASGSTVGEDLVPADPGALAARLLP